MNNFFFQIPTATKKRQLTVKRKQKQHLIDLCDVDDWTRQFVGMDTLVPLAHCRVNIQTNTNTQTYTYMH